MIGHSFFCLTSLPSFGYIAIDILMLDLAKFTSLKRSASRKSKKFSGMNKYRSRSCSRSRSQSESRHHSHHRAHSSHRQHRDESRQHRRHHTSSHRRRSTHRHSHRNKSNINVGSYDPKSKRMSLQQVSWQKIQSTHPEQYDAYFNAYKPKRRNSAFSINLPVHSNKDKCHAERKNMFDASKFKPKVYVPSFACNKQKNDQFFSLIDKLNLGWCICFVSFGTKKRF